MVGRSGSVLCAIAAFLTGIIALIVLERGPVFGQSFSAVISGVVRDATEAVVPGVTVTAKHMESGLTRTVKTNETGDYKMQSLPVGPYEVTTDMQGFKQQVRRGINLVVGQ